MDVIKAIQNYVNKMIDSVSGMKVLLLDEETTPILSITTTQSFLLSKEIYLIDKISNSRQQMRHLKCIVFIRPTDSINYLLKELQEPKYGDYYIFFSNTCKKSDIERMAEADEFEVVREVQEYYADYLAINPELYSLSISRHLVPGNFESWDSMALTRTVHGVLAVLLSMKKKPLIRYESKSLLGKRLATEVQYAIQQEGPLFDFRKTDTPPILLILDRKNDPVTPLLSQWTYQALVHEMIGIQNGRVDLSYVADIRPEMKEVVLSFDHDSFYQKNMFLNLGDLGANIKQYVDEYQVKHKSSKNIESIADMKKFVEDYPEFRKLAGNVSKHVTLVSELSRLVAKEDLLLVGELEQNLACIENHAIDSKAVEELLLNPNISNNSKIRITLLYALRYENLPGNCTVQFIEILKKLGLEDLSNAVYSLLQYGGADQRMEDIFSNNDLIARTKSVFKGLKGVENIYTQHTPHLVTTLQLLMKGKLKDQLFPFLEGNTRDKPQDVIIFMIGGVTYAEARAVNHLNTINSGTRFILGGTNIHNTKSFLDELLSFGGKKENKSSNSELRSIKSAKY